MAFMQPQITSKGKWLKGESKFGGTYFAPDDQFSRIQFATDVLGYGHKELDDSDILDGIERIDGYGVRRSAPGYMDCTDWEVFTSYEEAHTRFKEMLDEDKDPEEPDPETLAEPEHIIFAKCAKVFHHTAKRGKLVATIEFNDKTAWAGEGAAEIAVEETITHGRSAWWMKPWTNAEITYCRDTRPGDRILIENEDGSNDMFTVEAINPIKLYHGAK